MSSNILAYKNMYLNHPYRNVIIKLKFDWERLQPFSMYYAELYAKNDLCALAKNVEFHWLQLFIGRVDDLNKCGLSPVYGLHSSAGKALPRDAERATGSNPVEAPKTFFGAFPQLPKFKFTAMVTY